MSITEESDTNNLKPQADKPLNIDSNDIQIANQIKNEFKKNIVSK